MPMTRMWRLLRFFGERPPVVLALSSLPPKRPEARPIEDLGEFGRLSGFGG